MQNPHIIGIIIILSIIKVKVYTIYVIIVAKDFAMKIKNVNTMNFTSNQKVLQSNKELAFGNNNGEEIALPTSSYGEAQVSLSGIDLIKESDSLSDDAIYRRQLLSGLGKNPEDYHKLRSIVGPDEIKTIMQNFNDNEDFYSVGVNDSNIANKTIRANLHMHTTASDGFMPVQEILDKAAAYADSVAEAHPEFSKAPFTIGITDHDTTESCSQAIDIISANPEKYKNLRVILGIEMTSFNDIATDIVNYPTNAHTLIYGINPNEEVFKKFIAKTKAKKEKVASKMIARANKLYKQTFDEKQNPFSLLEAQMLFDPLDKNILGTYNYAKSYVLTKAFLEQIILKNPDIANKLKANNIPADSSKILRMIHRHFFEIDKTASPRTPEELISKTLSKRIGMEEEDITNVIKGALKTRDLSVFYENMLTALGEIRNDNPLGLLTNGYNKQKIQELSENMDSALEEYKRTLHPKMNYMPTWENLSEALRNQPNAIIGIAHPLDTVRKITDNKQQKIFLLDLYKTFKEKFGEKATFSEAYYQSYKGNLKELSLASDIKKLLSDLSRIFRLFKTGSADTHGFNIFKRI